MSDTTPTPENPDTTPTESIQLADQQPLAAEAAPSAAAASDGAAAAPRSGGRHTRTILEVVGGVVAAGLIVVAGAVGFAVGHATGDDDGRWSMSGDSRGGQYGPEAGGPMGDGGPMGQGGPMAGDRDGGRGHHGDRDGR